MALNTYDTAARALALTRQRKAQTTGNIATVTPSAPPVAPAVPAIPAPMQPAGSYQGRVPNVPAEQPLTASRLPYIPQATATAVKRSPVGY